MRRFAIRACAALLGVVVLSGCGDGSENAETRAAPATTVNQPDETVRAYCEADRKLDEQQGRPTVEQLQELADLAPPAIKKDVDLVAERFTAEGDNAADDPAVLEALDRLDIWTEQNCGAQPE